MYSRLVAWLKILLPLGALVLLSTIFMYSRGPDPISTIPMLENGVDPSESEQIGKPFFAGTTESGRALTLSARQARAKDGNATHVLAEDLRAVLESGDQNRITIDAQMGEIGGDDLLMLREGVVVQSTTGYTVRAEGMDAAINRVDIDSTGRVDADGPGLTLSAGRMEIDEAEDGSGVRMVFTNGVEMVYTPQTDEAEQ